ncbi:MAG: S8 family serine peptidase [Armatimonadetes bacterium]|nr:S8 family serine peptidase [Armatimonadota bacterium]
MSRALCALAGLCLLVLIAGLGGCGGMSEAVGTGVDTEGFKADPQGRAPVLILFQAPPGAADEGVVQGLGGKVKQKYHLIPGMAAELPVAQVDALRRHPRVRVVEPDGEVEILAQTLPWGVDRVDAERVHPTNKGTGVKIAIVDTGIDYTHEDLVGNYADGVDLVATDGDETPMDYSSHGTHCAGIAAAVDNEVGVVGVAPEASLYAVQVLNAAGMGVTSEVISGIQWCADNGMQIVSMSFRMSDTESGRLTCDNAYAAGLLLVAAAGNYYSRKIADTVTVPARYDSVIAVAATDTRDARASFSSTGPAVELAAPGVDVNSCIPGGYGLKSGTSMACPHVAGAAALVWVANPTMTAAQVRQQLHSTALDLGGRKLIGRDPQFGYGLLQADTAAGVLGLLAGVLGGGPA